MIQQEISTLFRKFQEVNALIIGDVMVDSYFKGKVNRISPEAPVPVVSLEQRENRLGGAANVAINMKALGANPILCAVVGNDEFANVFEQLLEKREMSNAGIIRSGVRYTTVKTRIIGNNHQLLRVDAEIDKPLSKKENEDLLDRIDDIISTSKIDVIVFEDYNKGVLTKQVIQHVIKLAKKHGIPTTVDPKSENYFEYKGVTLFKPNLKELEEGLNMKINAADPAELSNAADLLAKKLDNEISFFTLSEKGVFIKSKDEQYSVAAHVRNISDVSGAGDTVIAVASLCLALDQNIKTIASLSNLAGGLVCEKVGVIPIDREHFFDEALVLMHGEK